jgi:glycosyltransferase involved in cell wall biosynthesis
MSIGMDDVVAICVARLAAVKGIDVLIRAMALLKDRQIKCRCLVIGDGPLAEPLSSLAASLGVSDLVIFKGFQNDVWPYLLASDIFVLPSYSEGLPFSVLEAMACALPCVVTDVGGNREAVEHGVHGLVVPPGSEENLGAAVAKLVMDYETRKKMAQAAKLRAKREFDIDDRMSEVVQTLLT